MNKFTTRLFAIVVITLGLVFGAQAQTVNTQNPYQMIEQAAQKTFDRFKADKSKIDSDPNYLKVVVEDELLPYVDYKYASYKVLGKYLRKTTKSQREAFTQAFRDYLISTYASAFTAYTNQTVRFSSAKNLGDEKVVNVSAEVIEQGRPPIKLVFKVRRLMTGKGKERKPREGDHWKAIDLVAEGVSLLQSKQSEIGSLVRQKGIDAVTEQLSQQAHASIEAKKEK